MLRSNNDNHTNLALINYCTTTIMIFAHKKNMTKRLVFYVKHVEDFISFEKDNKTSAYIVRSFG